MGMLGYRHRNGSLNTETVASTDRQCLDTKKATCMMYTEGGNLAGRAGTRKRVCGEMEGMKDFSFNLLFFI